MKRRGNRRYYQHHEVLMIRRIRDLLYDQGFTISGARNKMQELLQDERDKHQAGEIRLDGVDVLDATGEQLDDFTDAALEDDDPLLSGRLHQVRLELFEIRELLSIGA
jgi:DNA-binding transcriptional MerR regulator